MWLNLKNVRRTTEYNIMSNAWNKTGAASVAVRVQNLPEDAKRIKKKFKKNEIARKFNVNTYGKSIGVQSEIKCSNKYDNNNRWTGPVINYNGFRFKFWV